MDNTLTYYQENAQAYYQKHKDDDLSTNYALFQKAWLHKTKKRILDFACGPGRDILYFQKRGYKVEAFDACPEFCEIASEINTLTVECKNFYDLDLKKNYYDGVFANSVIFHIEPQELNQILREIHQSLAENGVFFSNIPLLHPTNTEDNGTFINLMKKEEYLKNLENAGFKIIEAELRPLFLPVEEQNWLAVLAQKLRTAPAVP